MGIPTWELWDIKSIKDIQIALSPQMEKNQDFSVRLPQFQQKRKNMPRRKYSLWNFVQSVEISYPIGQKNMPNLYINIYRCCTCISTTANSSVNSIPLSHTHPAWNRRLNFFSPLSLSPSLFVQFKSRMIWIWNLCRSASFFLPIFYMCAYACASTYVGR